MGNNSVPKFIFRLSRFPVYRGSGLGRFLLCKVFTAVSIQITVLCVLTHCVGTLFDGLLGFCAVRWMCVIAF
jgi:hypothetical protein